MRCLIVVFLPAFAILFVSCSKDSSSSRFADAIKNSIWTGELRYDGRTVNEPYSLYFDGHGNIEWNEWNGTYTGTYTVNSDTRSVNVIFASGSSFRVIVSGDNKLTEFEYGSSYNWNIVSGQKYMEGEVELTGTWPSGSSSGHQVAFTGPSTLKLGSMTEELVYSRRYGSIRFGYHPQYYFFGIVTKNSIKGIYSFSAGPSGLTYTTWQANNF